MLKQQKLLINIQYMSLQRSRVNVRTFYFAAGLVCMQRQQELVMHALTRIGINVHFVFSIFKAVGLYAEATRVAGATKN